MQLTVLSLDQAANQAEPEVYYASVLNLVHSDELNSTQLTQFSIPVRGIW